MENFGRRLNEILNKKGWSQQFLANALEKKGRNVVSNWVNNKAKPSADDLAKIAKLLDTSIDYLLFGRKHYEVPDGMILITNEDALKYERILRKESEAEVEKLKNIEVLSYKI